jgi:uncharacterized hydrophobic protein (TIGR00271 family)
LFEEEGPVARSRREVLQLRVYGEAAAMAAVADRLDELPGMRHVGVAETGRGGAALMTADVRSEAADGVLETLEGLGVAADDIALVRLDTIGPASSANAPTTLVWAEVLGQARALSRAHVRYFVLMAAAGVVACAAVVNDSATLIVGAMAISPDLFPITAACAGIVLGRGRLVRRGLGTLLLGLATSCVLAIVVAAALDLFDALPADFSLHDFSAAQTHVNATTILVALAAGVAGMLAVETRASAAVGVAISVTTIPATAYLGVAIGLGEVSTALSALGVLGANIAMMLIGGSTTLAAQRIVASRPALNRRRA